MLVFPSYYLYIAVDVTLLYIIERNSKHNAFMRNMKLHNEIEEIPQSKFWKIIVI